MESIRSVIKERIKSCISCDAEQCPVIKQRLDQHVMSHHSSASRTCSNQIVHQNQSKPRISTESKISIVKLDDSTSTSDISHEKIKKKSNNTNYKQSLKLIISEWSNDIPNISEDPENIKQNKLNELIEKVYELNTEINNIYYETKLNKSIDEYLSSVLAQFVDEITMRDLKENLVTEIQVLNKKTKNNEYSTTAFKSNIENNNETKDIAVNTLKTAFKHKINNLNTKYRDASTQNSLNDSSIGDYSTIDSNKANTKVFIDNQVQHTLSNVFPFHTSINTVLKKNNSDETEEDIVHKRSIFDWLLKLNKEGFLNFDQEDIYYDDVMENLFNHLKPILNLKSYRFDKNNLLKDEIFNFTVKNINMSLNAKDIFNINKLANTLAIHLLNKKHNYAQNEYSQNRVYKIIDSHPNEDFDALRLINDVVVNSLVSNGIYSDQLINNMVECILNNINSTDLKQNLNTKLSNYLKYSTGLSEIDIANIVSNITKEISRLNYKIDISKNSKESWCNSIISVYKSEVDLIGQPKNTNSSTSRRKSSVVKNKKPNSTEINYMNKISAAITSWFDALPIGSRKAKIKKNKQNFVQNLTNDILDQVKLHSLIEENNEKDRYVTFFIYRWLNRYEFFDNIDEAKPFVDQLLKEITDIPEPIRNEETKDITIENDTFDNQSKSSPTKEFSQLKNEFINLINGLSPKNVKIKDKNKRNKIIEDLVLQVQNLITNKQSIDEISKAIDNYITQIIYSDQKQIIAKINKDLMDKAHKFLQNTPLDTTTRIDNKVEASEEILKNYITKYLDHRFDPEDSITRVAFTQLLKNELDNLSTPKRHPNASSTNYKQEELLINKLSKELEYINIIIDWLKSLPLEESFNTIDHNTLARSINKLAKDIYEIVENLSKPSSDGNNSKDTASEIEIFLEQLPISPQNRKNITAMIDDLVSKIANFNMSQGTCCQVADCQTDSNVGKQSKSEHDISNFIEEYIRNNSDEISQDDLKLEACILRFFEEIDQKETEHLNFSKSQLHNNSNDKELQSNETARRFSFELGYANEISQWLKNLPLTPIIDEKSRTQVGNMVSSLAKKVFEKQMENNNLSLDKNDLVDYINDWIVSLPLDPSKSIDLPVAVQQLLNRLERVDVDKYLIYSKKEKDALKNISMITKSHACCGNQEDDYLGSTIINEIESWCNSLPIQSESESNNDTIKQNVATKLYRKIRELNMNPEYFTDDVLYQELLNEEIERLLEDVPQNSRLKSLKDVLKKQLLNSLIEKRIEIKEKSSAIEYRHDLEKTIDISMPHPVSKYLKESPGFKLYKDRLASMFILENFDHGNDSVKQKYEERLKIEIDKYFEDAQVRSSIPLSKDQMYNELYSALFSVPPPNESFIIEEVEEIKTRCEIDKWFETLPLNEATGVGELLEWDQILAMLAKRLHEMEKVQCGRETRMHNEITKWLLRLPIMPCQKNNIDYFANDLKNRLQSTQENRKCLSYGVNRTDEYSLNNSNRKQENLKNNQISRSSINQDPILSTSLPACCQTPPSQPPQSLSPQDSRNPADIIIKIVETWCQTLPLSSKTPQDKTKVMKDHIAIKIIMKISEMNMNPEIFEDNFLYNGLLEDELDNQLAKLPTNSEFNQYDAKKQLINAIETVKPLIKEEKLRYEYKYELKNTIDNVLNAPQTKNSNTTAALASLRDEIADDFIVFEFQAQGSESLQIKDKIYQLVQTFLEISNENEESSFKPLIVTNQLICELRKISVPNELVIIEELKEIEIKYEIAKFFDDISLAEDFDKLSNKNQVKSTLAKRLSDFEKIGYTKENCFKMKKEVIKCIRKIDDNVDAKKVEEFIGTLQKTYHKRMSISQTIPQINDSNENIKLAKSIEVGEADFSANTDSKQWHSLLPATTREKNIQNKDNYNILNDTSTNYRNFRSASGALSSVRKDQAKQGLDPNNSRYLYNTDQNASRPSTSSPKTPYRNNISQNRISGISDSANSKRSQNQNTQNQMFKGSEQQAPLYPDPNQQYTHYQDTEEKFTNTSPYQSNRHFQNNQQFKDNSFEQMPGVEQGGSDGSYNNSLGRNVSSTHERWMSSTDTQNLPKPHQLHRDISLSHRGSESPNSYMSNFKARRTCRRRPSITIFSPSYLEPENESQESFGNKKCKSKKCLEGNKVRVECRCEKKAEDKIECRCDKKEDKIDCRCEKKDEYKIECKCDEKDENKVLCKCAKKGKCKPNWSINIRKYCKYCNRVHPFDCRMLNYSNCYY